MEALWKKQALGRKGFTLIELIVVIAIIAILAVILIPRFVGFTDSANEKAAISDTRNILLAVQALQANGTVVSTTGATALGQINSYAGSNFSGTLNTTDVANGNFTYATQKGTKTWTITVSNFQIIADPTASGHPTST